MPSTRKFSPPATADVQTEHTIKEPDRQAVEQSTTNAEADEAKQEKAARVPPSGLDTTALARPGAGPSRGSNEATHGEALGAALPRASPVTEARIDRDLALVARTGEVPPRSTIAPAKPARPPDLDEQRMAEDYDPPPLGHRPEVPE